MFDSVKTGSPPCFGPVRPHNHTSLQTLTRRTVPRPSITGELFPDHQSFLWGQEVLAPDDLDTVLTSLNSNLVESMKRLDHHSLLITRENWLLTVWLPWEVLIQQVRTSSGVKEQILRAERIPEI